MNRRIKRQLSWTGILTLIAVAIFFPIKEWVLPTWPWIIIWGLILTIITVIAFAYDKQQARRNERRPDEVRGQGRIPEVTLLWLILIGGTIGAAIGMWGLRHKTSDRKFLTGFVVALVLQALVIGIVVGDHLLGTDGPTAPPTVPTAPTTP